MGKSFLTYFFDLTVFWDNLKNGLDRNHFQLREYDAIIGRWTSIDPERQYYSPYVGNGNNPIINVDPTGGLNPIYGSDGNFRGVDEFGLKGEAIVYDGAFTNGMKQSDILANGGNFLSTLEIFSGISSIASQNILDHFVGLSSRPDWDGIVTLQEAEDWFNAGSGDPLYVDISKINFKNSGFSVGDFNGFPRAEANFFKHFDTHPLSPNILWRPSNDVILSRVYGTLRFELLDPHTGLVNLRTSVRYEGGFDGFDFNIPLFGWITGLGGDNPTPFNFMGYGNGHIRTESRVER
jgi:RHS repeat-associated protein